MEKYIKVGTTNKNTW